MQKQWPQGIIDFKLDRLEDCLVQGEYEEFDIDLENYLKEEQQDRKIHYALLLSATRLSVEHQFSEAIIILEGLNRIYPDAPRVINELRVAYTLAGNLEKAKKLSIPDSSNIKDKSDSIYGIALIEQRLGNFSKACDVCLQALDTDSTHRHSLELFCSMIEEDSQYEIAVTRAKALLAESPFDFRVRKAMTTHLDKLGRRDEAYDELLILNHLQPLDSQISEQIKTWEVSK